MVLLFSFTTGTPASTTAPSDTNPTSSLPTTPSPSTLSSTLPPTTPLSAQDACFKFDLIFNKCLLHLGLKKIELIKLCREGHVLIKRCVLSTTGDDPTKLPLFDKRCSDELMEWIKRVILVLIALIIAIITIILKICFKCVRNGGIKIGDGAISLLK
ncbi:6991_t:CDS:1 [Paraglomus occultum]|uniref:6991_t:CDS:1 n=1 Tax=Paraglomus occultum TaxID=144539 RepID=A0A9N9A1S9_9GLOM|nr:6991_t:CDS:1 [Paraglomus occultum]